MLHKPERVLHTHCLFNGVIGLVTLALWEGTGLEDPHRPLRVETLLYIGGEGKQPCASKITPACRARHQVKQKPILKIHLVEERGFWPKHLLLAIPEQH